MKRYAVLGVLSIMLLFFASCYSLNPSTSPLTESVEAEVSGCEFLGTLSEDTDPGKLFKTMESYSCQNKIIRQAEMSGATHLIWLYRYDTGAAAKIYRCP